MANKAVLVFILNLRKKKGRQKAERKKVLIKWRPELRKGAMLHGKYGGIPKTFKNLLLPFHLLFSMVFAVFVLLRM